MSHIAPMLVTMIDMNSPEEPANTDSHEGHDHAEPERKVPVANPNPFTNSSTRVIAIASGKGGVGKSSITTNLAIALAQAGKRVAAVDADVWGFSMPRMLGVDRPPDVEGEKIIPPIKHDVALISMGYFAREDQPIMWRGPMLHKALEQFLTDVEWNNPEYLLVDMPPGTGDISLSIAQFLPRSELIVVTTPQIAAQSVAQRAAFMAKSVDLTLTGVIENMSYFLGDDGKKYEIFGSGGGQALADKLEVPLLGQVPLLTQLREGSDMGQPIMVSDPDNVASLAIKQIAQTLIDTYKPTKKYRKELNLISD
ncbi:MAG TPA: Mrp/NBP35 family ATP-binding protein [Acidimicrobiia bacterium]|nr:Mrp/NBP35 family ATP-binding protein [Acidimicrobiia bacterium]